MHVVKFRFTLLVSCESTALPSGKMESSRLLGTQGRVARAPAGREFYRLGRFSSQDTYTWLGRKISQSHQLFSSLGERVGKEALCRPERSSSERAGFWSPRFAVHGKALGSASSMSRGSFLNPGHFLSASSYKHVNLLRDSRVELVASGCKRVPHRPAGAGRVGRAVAWKGGARVPRLRAVCGFGQLSRVGGRLGERPRGPHPAPANSNSDSPSLTTTLHPLHTQSTHILIYSLD